MTEKIHKARGLEREFVILRNKEAQRTDLTYAAVGLLVYLMSLPEDWTIYVDQLKRKGAGRDKIRALLQELETAGFIHIEQNRNEGGTFTPNEYHAYAMPEYNPYYQPSPEKPLTVEPLTDKPLTVNPQLQRKQSTKETNHKANNNKNAAAVVPDDTPLYEQDTPAGRVYRFYESNFGLCTGHNKDLLFEYLNESGELWLIEAMKIAAKAGKRTMRYVDGILKNWHADGADFEQKRFEARTLEPDEPATPAPGAFPLSDFLQGKQDV